MRLCTCVVCGSGFEAVKSTSECCSGKCRDERTKVECKCERCGKAFEKRRRDPTRFCSTECKQPKTVPICTCKGCGNEYRPRAKAYATYCSRECYFSYRNLDHARNNLLAARQAGIEAKRYRAVSIGMARVLWRHVKADRQRQKQPFSPADYYRQKVGNSCSICGKDVSGWVGSRRCEACRESAAREARRNANLRKEIKKRANGFIKIDKVKRLKVYERDQWKCYLCGEQLNKDTQVPDPLAPTLDHVVPISKGGSHTYDNLRCACFKCNCIVKNDRPLESILHLPASVSGA